MVVVVVVRDGVGAAGVGTIYAISHMKWRKYILAILFPLLRMYS